MFLHAGLARDGRVGGAAGCDWVEGGGRNAGWRCNDSRELGDEACRMDLLLIAGRDERRRSVVVCLFGGGTSRWAGGGSNVLELLLWLWNRIEGEEGEGQDDGYCRCLHGDRESPGLEKGLQEVTVLVLSCRMDSR